MGQPNGEPSILKLEDLPTEYHRLNFLVDAGDDRIKQELEISLNAGAFVGFHIVNDESFLAGLLFMLLFCDCLHPAIRRVFRPVSAVFFFLPPKLVHIFRKTKYFFKKIVQVVDVGRFLTNRVALCCITIDYNNGC